MHHSGVSLTNPASRPRLQKPVIALTCVFETFDQHIVLPLADPAEMSTQKSLLLLEQNGSYAVRDTEIPKPGPGELLIEIHAAGLNPVDWKIHDYWFSMLKSYPAVLGTDAAGIVKEVGEGVEGFAVGDKV